MRRKIQNTVILYVVLFWAGMLMVGGCGTAKSTSGGAAQSQTTSSVQQNSDTRITSTKQRRRVSLKPKHDCVVTYDSKRDVFLIGWLEHEHWVKERIDAREIKSIDDLKKALFEFQGHLVIKAKLGKTALEKFPEITDRIVVVREYQFSF